MPPGADELGVSWGHGTVEELHGAGADAILINVADLALLGGSQDTDRKVLSMP